MGNELPKNWAITKLNEVVKFQKGKKPKILKDEKFKDSVPYLDIRAFEKDEIRRYADIKSSNLIKKEEIGIVWDGARSGWVSKNKEGAVGSTIAILKPLMIEPTLLYRFLEAKYNFINTNTRGIGIPHVDPDVLWNIDFPLPPLTEQNRIVTKLDQLFGQLELVKASLDNIPQLLQDFRQQVLTQAITGKLTEEWRVGRNIKKWQTKSLKDSSLQIFDGPFGSNLKTVDYIDSGIQVVRLENIKSMFFDNSKQAFVSKEKYLSLNRNHLRAGDLLFSSFVAEEIRATILPKSATPSINKSDVFCIRPDRTILLNEFGLYFLLSKEGENQINNLAHGVTRPRINTTNLKSLKINLPLIKEQQEIVRRVESLFAKADSIESHYDDLKEKIGNLPQTILHKAFKGELVAQLTSDGNAKDLLEEIKALKAGMGKKPRAVKKDETKTYKVGDVPLRKVAEKHEGYKN